MAMVDVSNYHDFVKALKKTHIPRRRMFGDMLPYIAVQRPREFSERIQAQNMTIQRSMEKSLRSYYIEKRRTVAMLDIEANHVYKNALRRHKALKISQRKRRLEDRAKEEAAAAKRQQERQKVSSLSSASSTSQSSPFLRRSSVIEVAKFSKSSVSFRRGKERSVMFAIDDDDTSPLQEKEEETGEKKDLSPLEPTSPKDDSQVKIIAKQKRGHEAGKVLPPLKVPPTLQKSTLTPEQRRVRSTLHSIPEDEPTSVPNQRSFSSQLPSSNPIDLTEMFNNLPSSDDYDDESNIYSINKRQDYDKPWRIDGRVPNKREVSPLVSTVTRYTDWTVPKGSDHYRPRRLLYVEPKLHFFSYQPMLQIKSRIQESEKRLDHVLSCKLRNFYKDRPLDAPITPDPRYSLQSGLASDYTESTTPSSSK